jgi:hypothetical protein
MRLWILAALLAFACSFQHERQDDLTAKSTAHVLSVPQPWTFNRKVHGRFYAEKPDGGLQVLADFDADESAHSEDGGFTVEDEGLDLRAHHEDEGKTKPAIPVFGIAGALFALAALLYLLARRFLSGGTLPK